MSNNTLSRYDDLVFALHYELTESHRQKGRDVVFYQDYFKDKAGLIVDLGCGTGRFTIALAQMGCDIVGVDAAGAMLALARAKSKKAQQEIRYIQSDVVNLKMDKSAKHALMGYNTIAFIEEERFGDFVAMLSFLIAKGGSFVFDMKESTLGKFENSTTWETAWSDYYTLPALPNVQFAELGGLRLRRKIEQEFVEQRNVIITTYKWEMVHKSERRESRTTEMTFSTRPVSWFIEQFEEAGFTLGQHKMEESQHYVEMLW